MGVKGFATWLARTYPECFVPQQQQEDEQQQQQQQQYGGTRGGGAAAASPSAAGRRPDWASRPSELPTASPNSSRPVAPASFDHVYVDMASLLHTALRQGNYEYEGNEGERKKSRFDEIDKRRRKKLNVSTSGEQKKRKKLFSSQPNPRATLRSSSSAASTPSCATRGPAGPWFWPSTGPPRSPSS